MNAVTPNPCLQYLEQFTQRKVTLPGRHLQWLTLLREEAMKHFLATGFPTLRDEDWKYTSVAPIEKSGFALATDRTCEISSAQIDALALNGSSVLTFVDGYHAPALSRAGVLPEGVTVANVAAMLDSRPEEIEAEFCRATPRAGAFSALNTACMNDGAYVCLAAGATLPMPIHLLFIATTPERATHTHNLVVAGHDSRAGIVEHHVALGASAYFTNVVTDIVLRRGARVEHYKWQEESTEAFHIATINAELARDAYLLSASFALGGALTRTEIQVGLNGEGAECTLDGLYMADGRQHLDHHTRIDHSRPRGTSRELYKGVLGGASRGVFNGKVIVHPDAQRSDAAQTNHNLLLSRLAEIDTKPQLEIWADDVKCTHGATVGQLDADQVFYLRSRGVDDASARALLTYAFAAEMIQRVGPVPLRERIDGVLRSRLPQPMEALP